MQPKEAGVFARSALAAGLVALLLPVVVQLTACRRGSATLLPTRTLQSLSISPQSATLLVGDTVQLTATGSYDDDTTAELATGLDWSTDAPAAATVDDAGKVTGVSAAATVQVTATDSASGVSAVAQLEVSDGVLVSLTATASPNLIDLSHTAQMTALGTFEDGVTHTLSSGIAWTSANDTMVAVDATGLATPVATGGPVSITATHGATGLSASADVTVQDEPTLVWGSADIPQTITLSGPGVDEHNAVVGLVPGVVYQVQLPPASEDFNLEVYGDADCTDLLCSASEVGADSCAAAANADGQLFVHIITPGSGSFSNVEVDERVVAVETVQELDYGSSGFLTDPVSTTGSGDDRFFKVVGATPGTHVPVQLKNMTADFDLWVYSDASWSVYNCSSANAGTAAESCNATPNADGELYIRASGEKVTGGGSFQLYVH